MKKKFQEREEKIQAVYAIEEPVLTSDCKWSDSIFSTVVVHGNIAVFKKCIQMLLFRAFEKKSVKNQSTVIKYN